MFIATSFTRTKTWRQLKCPLEGWINRLWYKHTMEFSSSIKRNEVLTHVTMWMNLENIMLSERSQYKGPCVV
jgi:hypothetical protein